MKQPCDYINIVGPTFCLLNIFSAMFEVNLFKRGKDPEGKSLLV